VGWRGYVCLGLNGHDIFEYGVNIFIIITSWWLVFVEKLTVA
jgi:hypothetical protein